VENISESFPVPTLIITGRQDAVVSYSDAWNILEKYRRATFFVSDRAEHQLEETEDLVNALINEWLDRVQESVRLI
jgi:pimeloyl-ACP methyl ester carboxylesterase